MVFSFSRPGEVWFAWEWLADCIFSYVHSLGGLTAVAFLGAALIAASTSLLFRLLEWLGAGRLCALAVVLMVCATSSIHYLARPHLFTFLFLPAALWLLERERRERAPEVWLLVPMVAVWTNLHGGFVLCLALLGVETAFSRSRRLVLLFSLCCAATLLNPYGWRLHQHVFEYLNAEWIRNSVQEFQPFSFRGEVAVHFSLLLFGGILSVAEAWRTGRRAAAVNTILCAFFALQSARHIPIYAIVAAPWIALSATRLCNRHCCHDLAAAREPVAWPFLAIASAAFLILSPPTSFPAQRFPLTAISHARGVHAARLLTTDQWADLLIYLGYPNQKVFLDGRTDFYGRSVSRDYSRLMLLDRNALSVLESWRFDAALLPRDWPLVQVFRRDSNWRLVYQDDAASLFLAPSQR